MSTAAAQSPQSPRPSRWRRILGWLLLGLLLAALCAAAGGLWLGQRLLQEQGIARLDWQGLAVSRTGLRLQRLAFDQQRGQRLLQLQAEELELTWKLALNTRPALRELQARHLTLDWRAAAAGGGAPLEGSALERLAARLAWLPPQVRIEQLDASLPCAKGRCQLQGTLHLAHGGPTLLPLDFDLQLKREQQRLHLTGQLHGSLDDLGLQLQASLDEQPLLQVHSRLSRADEGRQWSGQLELPRPGEIPALHDWLGEWLVLPELPTTLPAELPEQLLAQAQWRLLLPGEGLSTSQLRQAGGELELDLHLPSPWPLPGIGSVQGELRAGLQGSAGRWQARRLHADLQLSKPQGTWLVALPARLRPQSLHLQLEPLTKPLPGGNEAPLGMHMRLAARGALDLELDGALHAWLRPDWAIALPDARLQAKAAQLTFGGQKLDGLQADLRLTARLDAQGMDASLADGSQAQLKGLTLPAAKLRLEGLSTRPAGLQLRAGFATNAGWRLHGPLPLQAERLRHARLRTQAWLWQSRLDATPRAISLDGRLDNDAGLQLEAHLQHTAAGLSLRGQLQSIDLATDNPLERTLRSWPGLLEASAGRLNGAANLRLSGAGAPHGEFSLQLDDAAAIYDRSELSGLNTRLLGELRGGQLYLELPALRLARLNPGIELSALRLRASYQATLNAPLAGQVQLWQADGTLLGGHLSVEPARLQLDRRPQQLVMQVRGLDLAELLRVYPTEGLSGSGLIDGRLPLRFEADGLHIDAGQIAARPPGGFLRLRSERIRSFARGNSTLQLATTALEDFRYDRLDSKVHYAPSGQLLLALHLYGRNPALEGGRDVNLNINLEENVPSLLSSLLLSGRVNEAIQRRVQQRLPQRP